MNYYISRSGQQYGPYSLADLQRYVQQGNISLNDLARSDGMTDWVPVSQVMGNISTPPAAPVPPAAPTPYNAPQTPYNTPATPYGGTPASNPYGAPATPSSGAAAGGYNPPSNPYGSPATPAQYTPPANPYGGQVAPYGGQGAYGVPQQPGMYPPPPSLQWPIVLLIALVTCGLFTWVWIFIEAAWVKKVRPQCNAMMLFIIGLCASIGGPFVGTIIAAAAGNQSSLAAIGGVVYFAGSVGGWVLFIMGSFSMKSAIEDFYNHEENVGLNLSGVMTFFFAVFYFQYHFTRITQMKQQAAMQQRGAGGGQYYGQ